MSEPQPVWPATFDPAIVEEFKRADMSPDEWRKQYLQEWPLPVAGDGDDGRNHRDIKRHRAFTQYGDEAPTYH